MLTMTQIDDIRRAFFMKGKTFSEISKEFKVDRKTVRKYIGQDNWNVEVKTSGAKRAFPKLEPFKADIDGWLEEDKKARRKQRHTAKRIYERLREKYQDKFNCSYRTIASYMAMRKKHLLEGSCFLPLKHIPGEAQADFGEADFYEDGTLFHGYHLNLSFPYSNAGYVQLFKGENLECLQQGLKDIFEHIGGVPQRIWSHNASAIVKFTKKGERVLSQSFLRFKQHYGFEAVFCNPYSGHEKGSVESKVGYHRRNFLVPAPRFERCEEFNRRLLDLCDEDMHRRHYRHESTIASLFDEDCRNMLKLPESCYEVATYVTVKTNAYAKFSLNAGCHTYSTSPRYANSRLLVKLTAHEVIALDEDWRQIANHRRLYGPNCQESMNWLPYLAQIARRPRALKYSGIYELLPQAFREYLDGCDKNALGQSLRALALLCSRGSFEVAVNVAAEAVRLKAQDLDSLLVIYSRMTDIRQFEAVISPAGTPKLAALSLDAKSYDEAFLKREKEGSVNAQR